MFSAIAFLLSRPSCWVAATRPMRRGARPGRRATREPRPWVMREGAGRSRVQGLGWRKIVRTKRRGAGNSRIPASLHRGSDARGRRAPGERLADQELERSEVTLGQVLEASAARGDGLVGRGEALDYFREVLGVLAELQLHRPADRGVTGQRQRRLLPVAARLDQRAEAEALEPLVHGTPVPSESPGGRLHVESVLAQRSEDGGVAGGFVATRFPRSQAQVFDTDIGSVGERQGLPQTVLELAGVTGPV